MEVILDEIPNQTRLIASLYFKKMVEIYQFEVYNLVL